MNSTTTTTVLQRVVRVVLLALTYALSGRLSMLLAVPPGFASAIFPPVGIGLGAVLIWGRPMLVGVFLGSTLLNVMISVSAGAPLSFSLLPVAAGIAAGSTLQVWLGAQLTTWVLRGDFSLSHERQILAFLMLGGPLSCLVGATVGVSVLHSAGIVPAAEVLHNWLNWWVGDSIGVLVMAPLMFIFFANPRRVWRGRINTVAIPLAISTMLVIGAFLWSSYTEQLQTTQRFSQQAQMIASSIKKRLDTNINLVRALERFFVSSNEVSRAEFARFVANLKTAYPSVKNVSWSTVLTQAQRQPFETWLHASGISDTGIIEKKELGQWVTAPERDRYVVMTYIEPLAENRQLVGANVAADPIRREVQARAISTGQLALSAPVHLLQDMVTQPKNSVLFYYPLFGVENAPTSPAERAAKIRGFVTAAVHMSDLINVVLQEFPPKLYQLQLRDVTDSANEETIYGSAESLPEYAQAMIWQEHWHLAGRVLEIRLTPSLDFLATEHSQQSWAILAGGLILSSLLGAFLLSTSGRTQRIQQLVDERTLALSAILNNAVEAIISFDEHNVILSANPAACALFDNERSGNDRFGSESATLEGRNIGAVLPALEQERDALLGMTRELNGNRVDGQRVTVEVSLSVMEIAKQRTYTCIGHDVSERKKMERLKSEFVATVSHELRTPLTSISGALSLLANNVTGTLPEQVQSLVNIAKSNSERLIAIVNDILDIERLESGQISMCPEVLELPPLLNLAIEQNQGYAERFRVQLRLDLPDAGESPVRVNVDKQRFLQIMANLISNAIKFSPSEGDVTVSVEWAEHSVRINVRDRGPGVPVEFRDRIFQKFAQADGTDMRQRGGTGLGLSITKVLVERMQGYISYHSVIGEGTTFYLIFPTQ